MRTASSDVRAPKSISLGDSPATARNAAGAMSHMPRQGECIHAQSDSRMRIASPSGAPLIALPTDCSSARSMSCAPRAAHAMSVHTCNTRRGRGVVASKA